MENWIDWRERKISQRVWWAKNFAIYSDDSSIKLGGTIFAKPASLLCRVEENLTVPNLTPGETTTFSKLPGQRTFTLSFVTKKIIKAIPVEFS